jgi:hypothetical protein
MDKRKQAKFQWFQNPSKANGENMNNIRCESFRTFRNENIRDLYGAIREFKNGYHSNSNTGNEKNGDILAASHNILNR